MTFRSPAFQDSNDKTDRISPVNIVYSSFECISSLSVYLTTFNPRAFNPRIFFLLSFDIDWMFPMLIRGKHHLATFRIVKTRTVNCAENSPRYRKTPHCTYLLVSRKFWHSPIVRRASRAQVVRSSAPVSFRHVLPKVFWKGCYGATRAIYSGLALCRPAANSTSGQKRGTNFLVFNRDPIACRWRDDVTTPAYFQ